MRRVNQLLRSGGFQIIFAQLALMILQLSGATAQLIGEPSLKPKASIVVTNLQQLSALVAATPRVTVDLRLDFVVCASSRADLGVVIAKDDSGVELLELGRRDEKILPGDRLKIEGTNCFLRRRFRGVEISRAPIVDNDGIHPMRGVTNRVNLTAGKHQLRLDWFNGLHASGLEVLYRLPGNNGAMRRISDSKLLRSAGSETNSGNQLRVDVYEGEWETVPEFDLLQSVKSGFTSTFDLGFNPRSEFVGMRFRGVIDLPADGDYTFEVQSDDGSLLFLDDPRVPLVKAGHADIPVPGVHIIDESLPSPNERRWVTVEGRVNFINRVGRSLDMELRSDPGTLQVSVIDADGVNPEMLLNSDVRVVGVARSVLTSGGRVVLGRLVAISGNEVTVLKSAPASSRRQVPLTDVGQVQSLRIDEAKSELPVRIRGVITSVSVPYWMSVQDETRGIFVKLNSIKSYIPTSGQSCEIIGKTSAGDFAPIVVADEVIPLGDGRFPVPARPTWNELINGSMDVQWVEFQGLVTAVQTNGLRLLLPEGHLDVQLEQYSEFELKQFDKSVIRIRGVFYAVWETETRAVRVGTVLMRNARISIETPAPVDPFDVPSKHPRDLFLFDPHATAFQRVKLSGQVVLAEPSRVFLMDGDAGLRVLPVQDFSVHGGDIIEAVGYPDISGSAPVLREAMLRKISSARLPDPHTLKDNDFQLDRFDSTLVRIDGRLMGIHSEQDVTVLEMRAWGHLFLARFRPGSDVHDLFQVGSDLALSGVYLRQKNGDLQKGETGTFELLLDSPASVKILSKPSWWTPRRLLTIVGLLLLVLSLAAVWISLLRRQVELRTQQLHREIREREAAERQRALEAERSRIARDLHDDLGSSLTEIGVLASTGQRPSSGDEVQTLFQSIAGKARGLISALDGIVWAIDPEDNSLQSVADYLSGFADEYLSHTTIACRFKVPMSFPSLVLDGRVRHDLLLTVKETLNNIVRHGVASEVEFRMAVSGENLEIEIADNGKGFDPATAKAGSGLKNLSSRLVNHGGSCRVESIVGKGTTVSIRLPLARGKQNVAGADTKDSVPE